VHADGALGEADLRNLIPTRLTQGRRDEATAAAPDGPQWQSLGEAANWLRWRDGNEDWADDWLLQLCAAGKSLIYAMTRTHLYLRTKTTCGKPRPDSAR
jgi:hypothetical protein